MKIDIFILDDDADAVGRMEFLLKGRDGLVVCGSETNPGVAIPLIRSLRPDLLFLDIEMPGFTGFEVLDKVRTSEYQPSVVFVTAYDRYAIEAIKASAFDYILKPVDPDELALALANFKVQSQAGKEKKLHGLDQLTRRELEIYELLQCGSTSREIASVLNISKNTVDTHRRHILKKLGLSSTVEIHLNTRVSGRK